MNRYLFFSFIFGAILILGFVAVPGNFSAYAQNSPVWERFSDFDPDSEITVNHSPLSNILRQTVFPFGTSKRILGTKANASSTYTGTRIARGGGGTASPSRYEGNRLMLHAFSDEHEDFFKGYQKGLENLSNRRPLRELNKNEQLAFWLNLHNVIVINKLIDEYPISKLKSLRKSKRGTPFWEQKVTLVEGVPLSLLDIENIVYHNFDNPAAIYGLFQGTIGGPSLPRVAFDGENVWDVLEDNAAEFVNSNRGVRPKGTKAEVSEFYEWSKAAFGNSDEAVLDHIFSYANYSFLGNISGVQTLKYKTYNWKIADLLGGTLHSGSSSNYAIFLSNANAKSNTEGRPNASSGEVPQFGSFDLTGWLHSYAPKGFNLENLIPPGAYELITAAFQHNDLPFRTPVITTIECPPGDPCIEVDYDN
ncbi:MAG: DUF547 domain-containing protein [Proteobacteria bacterium]|nr:DUF547 domain-containing protein [Pseudomonadota bacterium]